MPTKTAIVQPVDPTGRVAPPILVSKTAWQQFSEKAGWFVSGFIAGLVLAACGWLASGIIHTSYR